IHTPKHKNLIYDVGMHRGEDTEFYLKKGFHVIAFEADPEHVNFCRERLKKFTSRGQLKIIEGAIIDLRSMEAGQKKVCFYKNEEMSVWGTTRIDRANRNERLGTTNRMIEVDAINFAHAIEEHGVPYYMKIDIEGCDMVCINALKKFLKRPDYVS